MCKNIVIITIFIGLMNLCPFCKAFAQDEDSLNAMKQAQCCTDNYGIIIRRK